MERRLDRTAILLGEEKVNQLATKTVLVCGLGGVGGTCLESLARSGVGHFIIVDFDRVEESNLNRQLLFLRADVGEPKSEAASKRLHQISENIDVVSLAEAIDEAVLKRLESFKIDFVVDAIDSPRAKAALIEHCLSHEIPFISSLGMANRLDPSLIAITTLSETKGDPLASRMRSLLRKDGVDLNEVVVAYSRETPLFRGRKLSSVMNVPSSAGLDMSFYCLQNLLK